MSCPRLSTINEQTTQELCRRLGRDDAEQIIRGLYYGLSAARDRTARRLAFSDVLVQAFPEAGRAPLVLFRLYPLSVQVVTALAFGESLHANEIRNRQATILPTIENCQQCHGAVIENGEECQACGNPLWKYELLVDPY